MCVAFMDGNNDLSDIDRRIRENEWEEWLDAHEYECEQCRDDMQGYCSVAKDMLRRSLGG